jgi:20S proteasome alpha/beta subunit
MTIAAGIRCTDGIVLCSDTEHTEGDGKYEKPKIFSHDEWLLARSC